MKKVMLTLLGLCSIGLLANAQQTTQQPAQPAAPATAPTTIEGDVAMVRVLHLSPNADAVDIRLAGTREGGTVVEGEGLSGITYESLSDYLQIPAGEYVATVSAEGAPVLEQTVNFAAGNAYTVAAIGLVLPGEDVQATPETQGFFDWLGGLFGGDTNRRDALALRLHVVEDDLNRTAFDGEVIIRAVHASPGTDAIDIAFENERGSVIGSLAYGETSRYATVNLVEGEGNLVVRIAGSQAVVMNLSEAGLQPNTVNTIYIAGTSLDENPIIAVILTDQAMVEPRPEDAAVTTAPAQPVAPAPAAPATTAPAATQPDTTDPMLGTVVDVIAADPNLSTLVELLAQADLLDTLTGPGPFTVFAPTNDAFAALPQEQFDALAADPEMLRAVLLNHVSEGLVFSGDLAADTAYPTLQGENLMLMDDGTLSGANVVTPDLEASNGVVHVIDTVLLPQGMTAPATN
jgi:uncharacterized surface protein with fasciclin (FAS1) repeats